MRQAIEGMRNGLPYKTAARQFCVSLMSLKRRSKGQNKLAINEHKTHGSKTQVFTEVQEQELVAYILDMESRMYGLTNRDLRSIAYELASRNGLTHPYSRETELVGKNWLLGFQPGKTCKILAKRGKKPVGRVVSAERGVSTMAVICMSADGSYVPPMLIFSRKRMKEELKYGAPPGTTLVCNDSGWMNLDVFAEWFDHILHHVKPTAEDSALLILDGHLSYTKNLNVIEKA
ncbi:hypothetical protein CBL_11757 [Carabus blaptoides fortunei]